MKLELIVARQLLVPLCGGLWSLGDLVTISSERVVASLFSRQGPGLEAKSTTAERKRKKGSRRGTRGSDLLVH